jgi:hypothetical protein
MASEPGEFRSGSRLNLGGEAQALLWCLLLATILWFLLALNETYNSTIEVKVSYYNKPELEHYVRPLPEKLRLSVSAKGWDLLAFATRGAGSVNINLGDYERHNYILTNRLKGYLQGQLTHRLTIYDISPDTIPLKRSKLQTKRLPVRPALAVSFEKEHNISNPVEFEPDSITVSGPAMALEGLEYISTQPIILKGLNKSVKTSVAIKKPAGLNLTFSQEAVTVQIPVEKLTEQVIDIPVSLVNVSGNLKVNLIPQHVQLSYRTTLNNYGRINPNLFEAIVDGSKIDTLNKHPLKVQLISEPKFTYDIRLKQDYVDYIITR